MTFYPRAAGTICKRYRNRARTLVLIFLIPFVLFLKQNLLKQFAQELLQATISSVRWLLEQILLREKLPPVLATLAVTEDTNINCVIFLKLLHFGVGQITQFVGLPLLIHSRLNFFSSQGCQHMRSGWRNKMNGIYCVTNVYGAVQQLIQCVMKPKDQGSLAPSSVPVAQEKPCREHGLANKLCALKNYLHLCPTWLLLANRKIKKKYIGTRREAGAAYAKNPDHKTTFLVNTTNKLEEPQIRFQAMHYDGLFQVLPFKISR